MNEKEKEIMLIAQEECAEVTQAISKVFRFGFDATHPDRTVNNRECLEEEIGDLMCMVDLMIEYKMINQNNILYASDNKRKKLHKWSSIFETEQ